MSDSKLVVEPLSWYLSQSYPSQARGYYVYLRDHEFERYFKHFKGSHNAELLDDLSLGYWC